MNQEEKDQKIAELEEENKALRERITELEIRLGIQPFAYSRRTITAVGKIIAEMNRRDQIFNSHSQQSLYYNLRLWHKTADKSF